MGLKQIGIVWGPILMDCGSGRVNPTLLVEDFRSQCRVVEIIVENVEHIFEA